MAITVHDKLQELLEKVPQEYDIEAGSFFYDLLYPAAEEAVRLEEAIEKLQKNVFALTAEGEYLDKKVAEQGLYRKAPGYASGIVKISGEKGAIIRNNAKIASKDLIFAVNEAAIIPEEGYIMLNATCLKAGTEGNVAIGEINRFPLTLPGLTAVENIEAFTGGYAAESDDDLSMRYFEKVSKPHASGNVNDYEEWALEINGIDGVKVLPLDNGPGTVTVVVVGENNQPVTSEKLEEVKEHIDGVCPIGAEVTVITAQKQEIDISVKIVYISDTIDKESVLTNIKSVIQFYFEKVSLDREYVSYAKIGSAILSAEGVEDYAELKINNGINNIIIPEGYVPVLGEVIIGE